MAIRQDACGVNKGGALYETPPCLPREELYFLHLISSLIKILSLGRCVAAGVVAGRGLMNC